MRPRSLLREREYALVDMAVLLTGVCVCVSGVKGQIYPSSKEAVPSSWWSSLKTWSHGVKTIAGYVDSLAKEDCEEYTCADDEFVEDNFDHTPGGNGCGSFGYNVDKYIADGMIECCNQHDLCFSKCGVKKAKCDEKFKKCLYGTCRTDDHHKASLTVCQISAKMLYGATTLAGCSSFHAAQSNACLCKPRKRTARPDTNYHRRRSEL